MHRHKQLNGITDSQPSFMIGMFYIPLANYYIHLHSTHSCEISNGTCSRLHMPNNEAFCLVIVLAGAPYSYSFTHLFICLCICLFVYLFMHCAFFIIYLFHESFSCIMEWSKHVNPSLWDNHECHLESL